MLSVEGLVVRYGKTIAVSGVSFAASEGEIFGLLGPNGAGKTSIIKSIVGIIGYEGRIEIAGVDARSVEAKNLFGYVPEEVKLIDHLTPAEFFELVACVRKMDEGEANERVERLVRAFGLSEHMGKPIASLSMGNRKKVSIVAALMHDPPVLILDEPLNGLDAKSARILKEILLKLADNGGCVLLSTHIMEIAERLCDRIAVVNRGRIVAEGSYDELRAATSGSSLEEVFLKLTGQIGEVEEILHAL